MFVLFAYLWRGLPIHLSSLLGLLVLMLVVCRVALLLYIILLLCLWRGLLVHLSFVFLAIHFFVRLLKTSSIVSVVTSLLVHFWIILGRIAFSNQILYLLLCLVLTMLTRFLKSGTWTFCSPCSVALFVPFFRRIISWRAFIICWVLCPSSLFASFSEFVFPLLLSSSSFCSSAELFPLLLRSPDSSVTVLMSWFVFLFSGRYVWTWYSVPCS